MKKEEVIPLENGYFASMRYVGQKKFITSSRIHKIHGGLEIGDEILVDVRSIIKYTENENE